MLGDYLRSFWRGVLNNKIATFINVGGLVLGLTVFFALAFYVRREFSYDAHWQDADRIYRAAASQESEASSSLAFISNGPYVLGSSLQTAHPDAFEVFTRVYQRNATVEMNGEKFENLGQYYAEPSLLDLLQFETLEGSLQEVFADPRSIAISEQSARRLFTEKSPLGKTITFKPPQGDAADYVVKAVYRLPGPSTLNIGFLSLLDVAALPIQDVSLDLWSPPRVIPTPGQPAAPLQQVFNTSHYFKLREGVDPKPIEQALRALMDENKYMDFGTVKQRYVFQKLQDVHLLPTPFDNADSAQRLLIYAAIAALVLLISGCNFVMLSTLRLVDRLREVGIRKTVGGESTQLITQYLLDVLLQTLLASLIALGVLQIVLPKLQGVLLVQLQIDLWTWRNLAFGLVSVVLFTLCSSAYAAWLIARGKPSLLMRNGGSSVVSSGNALRKMLVGIQFALVVVLLLASAVTQQQIDFTRGRDRGYSLDNVVALRLNSGELFAQAGALINEFKKIPGVAMVAAGGVSPGTISITPPTIYKTTGADGTVREAGLQAAGAGVDFFKVTSVPIVAGREFTVEQEGQVTPAAAGSSPVPPPAVVILNESAVRALGFADPDAAIDQLVETQFNRGPGAPPEMRSLRVVGVAADTQFSSMMLPPVPQAYGLTPVNGFIAIKLEPGADATQVTEALKASWEAVVGNTPFIQPVSTSQMDGFQLQREQSEANIVTGSTGLALLIALLGLYGLVAATVVKRVKEIGVRKVMGADRATIVKLLVWQFSKPILVANLLAWPLGFWGISQWLQRFPYKLDNSSILLSGLAASVIALVVAWVTVGLMTAKAAGAKPVTALRYE